VAISVAWWSDTLLTAGSDGVVQQWSVTRGGLQPREQVQEAVPVRSVKAFADGWVYSTDDGSLSIGRAGRPPARLALPRPVQWIAVSPDLRYVAASVGDGIVVLDVRANKLAALDTETTADTTFNFLDANSLAVFSPVGLAVVHVDDMAYERF
jgi:hypothetical protein